ncbi:MAG: ASKHA domain-containing protein, partial [Actinomycetota bacterium]|nr:ASKHA domain-containing protein [Actinomycetota bacterium]
EWNLEVSGVDVHVLHGLHAAAATADRLLTAAVRRSDSGSRVVAVWPGVVVEPLGVAIDIGSTTIAGHLLDLSTGDVLASSGRMNPQIRLGEDLMSRVSYVMMNAGGDAELTALVREALADLLTELAERAGSSAADILEIVLVGNPIMHHLALGIDPTPLGQAPFVLATDEAVEVTATALDLPSPAARCYLAPCIAGHVGADTAAVILAEGPHRTERIQLLVDVGTNAEIVLGNSERLYAASSPTGPAFEGAQISCGQRATPGAIERVRIDRDTLEPRLKLVGCDLWSDEPGFQEQASRTGITGVCGSGIIEVLAEMFLAGIMTYEGVIDGSKAGSTERIEADDRTFSYVLHRPDGDGPTLRITQNDVRAVQLAKAALRAGIDLLMEHAHIATVDDVRLAGAFGAHIDPLYAMVLGLIPDCRVDEVRSVGNSAGTGAVRALLSAEQRREVEAVVRSVHKIETAIEPRFQELFVDAMALPHATAPTPLLAAEVELPARSEALGERRGRRRRARAASREGRSS